MTAEEIFPYATLPKIQITACPVCETRENPHTARADRYGYAVPIATCRDCHLGYLAEQLTREGYARLYNGAYRPLCRYATPKHASMTEEEYTRQTAESQKNYGTWAKAIVRRHALTAERLLDAGGSLGMMASWMGLTPALLTILDPAAQELPYGRPGVSVIHGYLEDPIPGSYDGVLCFQTMDHVTQPLAVLRHLRKACPMGWLLADYAICPEPKIDHPLYWRPSAWERALADTGWTAHERWPIVGQYTKTRARVTHVLSLCR